MKRLMLFVLAVLIVLPGAAFSGWFGDAVNGAIESTTTRKISEKVDQAADAADRGVQVDGEDDSGKAVSESDSSANEEKSGVKEERETSSRDPGDSEVAVKEKEPVAEAKEVAADKAPAQDMSVYRNYDFVPGEKIIFFDDFSDTDVGEFPPRWTFKGPAGGGGTLEVAEVGDKRYFFSRPPETETGQDEARVYIRMKDLEDLPKKFTVEFDAIFEDVGGYNTHYRLLLLPQDGYINEQSVGTFSVSSIRASSVNNTATISKSDGQLHHISVMVNDTFLKAYVDGDRVVNDPDGVERPIKHIGMVLTPEGGVSQQHLMFTNFRLAEGGKDIPKALETDGRIITHGIQFDTGSDKLKPQSYSTLKSIKDLLTKNAKLKFRIEGHTDDQGNPSINQPLSERRAEAVKAWLVQNGIGAERLATAGFGDTKPLSPNDTAEGRANNRRVEFIKI